MADPWQLLRLADEMAGRATEEEGFAGLAVLAAHAALESLVNQLGSEEIGSFKERARFLPKWHTERAGAPPLVRGDSHIAGTRRQFLPCAMFRRVDDVPRSRRPLAGREPAVL